MKQVFGMAGGIVVRGSLNVQEIFGTGALSIHLAKTQRSFQKHEVLNAARRGFEIHHTYGFVSPLFLCCRLRASSKR